MKPIKYWTDLYGIMPNHTILAYSRIYEDPEVSITINITYYLIFIKKCEITVYITKLSAILAGHGSVYSGS